MNREQAVARLRIRPADVSGVVEHPDGHVVTMKNGRKMLVTDTVARPYVPEVDGYATGGPVDPDAPGPLVEEGPPSQDLAVEAEHGPEPAVEEAKVTPARRSPVETAAIREWAKGAGYELADKGRIPANVVAAYESRDQEVTPDAGQPQD